MHNLCAHQEVYPYTHHTDGNVHIGAFETI